MADEMNVTDLLAALTQARVSLTGEAPVRLRVPGHDVPLASVCVLHFDDDGMVELQATDATGGCLAGRHAAWEDLERVLYLTDHEWMPREARQLIKKVGDILLREKPLAAVDESPAAAPAREKSAEAETFERARKSYLAQIRDLESRAWAARRVIDESDSAEANAVRHALNHPAE